MSIQPTKNQSRNNLTELSESSHTSQPNASLPPPNETIGEEFLRLSLGFRVRSSRQTSQTVQERKQQEQKEQLQQKLRRGSSKPKKKPVSQRRKSDIEADSQNAQQPNRSRQSSLQVQPPSLPSGGTGLLQSSSSVHQQQLHSKLATQMPLIQETPQLRVVLSNPLVTEWPKSAFSQPPRLQNPSPNKIKVKTSTYDKEFTEQLAEFKVLDKVMPCLDHVQGVFVQIAKSQEFATVLGFDGEHLLTLKTESSQVLEVPVHAVKFLAGAYVHPLSEIAMVNASDPLAIDLALNDQSKIDKSVVLIQTISNPISQDGHSSVGSIHRFHAMVLNGLTGKMTLHPVQFQSSQKQGKRQQKQAISEEEDTSKDNHELFAYQNQDVTRRILEFSRRIHAAYKNYKSKVQSIQLTTDNQQTLLNSVCAVYDHMTDENVCKYGVLTKVAAQKAFIRYFRTKAEWNNAPIQEWLNFDRVNIEADLTLGFVSKSTLFQRSIFDQKLRNVKFVSQLESIANDKMQSFVTLLENVCKKCNFTTIDSTQVQTCFTCKNSYHTKCLLEHQTKCDNKTNHWYCPECISCINCQAGSPDLIFCKQCNFSVHFECLDDEYKRQLEPYKNLQFDDFKCQNCIFCKQCGSKEADKTGQGTWSSDFQLCSPCEKKREKKMFCIGCLQFWQESESTKEMIQCSCCQMKVHPGCDRMLEDPIHLKQLQHKDENGKPTTLYACFSCRQKARADFIGQIVNYMISEDKREEFRYPFWQQPNNASYLTVIKTPLCFNMIKQEIDEFVSMPHSGHLSQIPELKYLSKPEKLGQDIDLLFWNAKTFNQPQSDIYKLSLRMHEKCTQILNQGRIKEILKDNSQATHDELLHLKFLRGSKTIEPEYKLKPKDLFQMHEQIDVNQYLYMLKSIEETNQTVSLGKRQRENQQAGGQKRQRLDVGEVALTQDIDLQFTDTRKIFMVANKRLLEQNLSKLRLNQSSFQNLQVDKSHYKPGENEVALLQQSPRSKWKALMDNLRLSDEGDSCWYSNPVRISFDDPSLIFEEMCYLCGSFGLREEFLCCNFCSESFHPYCLPCPKEITQTDKNGWFCYNCVFCEKCHSSKQWEGLVLCAVCDKADHYWCMQPQLVEVPDCSWKCPDCFKCRACGTKEFFSAEDIENKVNLDPNQKYTLSFDFEFCFQCGQDQYRKSFCKICEAKTGLGLTPQNQKKNYATQAQSQVDQENKTAQKEEISPDNSADLQLPNEVPPHPTSFVQAKEQITSDLQCQAIDLFKCSTCKYYSHLSCSRTNRSVIRQLSQTSYFRGFQCLDCILSERLPGFYLHEQCELYEDMHVRMEKFQLLSQLCMTILQKYTKGENFMIEQYVAQNFQWLSTSPVVMKWIQLLRSEVDYETSENSQTEQSALQFNHTVLPFSGLKGLTEPFSNEIEQEAAILKSRDLYLNLYKKVNGFEERTDSIPAIEFSEEWLKPNQIDFAEIYISVEMVAITRIRSHFFNWVQDKVVGPAIEHQDLFFKSNIKQKPNVILSQEDIEMKPHQISDKTVGNLDQLMFNPNAEICNDEDVTIVNPQNRLTCILCQQSGEKRITGRLIPFQVNQFVHVNCAMWTSEVKEGTEGTEETVISSELYNFYFAFKAFRNNVCTYCGLKGATLTCSNHAQNRKCAQPFFHFPCAYKSGQVSFLNSIEVFCETCTKKEKELQPGLPIRFRDYHRRRILIVKNIKPQCTEAFKYENGGDTGNKQLESNQPQQYYVPCNKWRPYYYDMFNRAGNLTIISLSQPANRVIEALHNQNNQLITWHDRLKKQTFTESPSDFASIRITWKDFDKNKGFFLFTQNESRLLQSKDVRQILPFMHKQLRQKFNLTSEPIDAEVCSVGQFWENQIRILRHRYENFSLDSTYLTPQNIQGLEKYPIQFWNNPSQKTGVPLKDLQVATFFYKSAELAIERQRLYTQRSQTEPQVQFEQPAPQGDLQNIFKKILDANKYVNKDGFTTAELDNMHNPKWKNTNLLTEAQLKQKLSSLNRSQPVLNQTSVKWMNYNQIMGCLGKKTMQQRKIMREAQTSHLVYDSDDENKKPSTVQQSLDTDGIRQLTENVSQARTSEQNLAMRFRAAKARPKQVEVWTSKIHRNGLFACQPLNPKDIVIEYVGEKITVPVADRREVTYEKIGVCDCYLFALDQEYIVDATFYGNKARYINHSCDPNLISEKIVVDGKTHIVFTASRHIEKDEELTFNYSFEYEENKIECFCGAQICKGRLN